MKISVQKVRAVLVKAGYNVMPATEVCPCNCIQVRASYGDPVTVEFHGHTDPQGVYRLGGKTYPSRNHCLADMCEFLTSQGLPAHLKVYDARTMVDPYLVLIVQNLGEMPEWTRASLRTPDKARREGLHDRVLRVIEAIRLNDKARQEACKPYYDKEARLRETLRSLEALGAVDTPA